MDPLWYKQIKKDDIWIKKTKNKNYFNSLKILSVINKRNKKCVKVEFPCGKRTTVEPRWLFCNYKVGDK